MCVPVSTYFPHGLVLSPSAWSDFTPLYLIPKPGREVCILAGNGEEQSSKTLVFERNNRRTFYSSRVSNMARKCSRFCVSKPPHLTQGKPEHYLMAFWQYLELSAWHKGINIYSYSLQRIETLLMNESFCCLFICLMTLGCSHYVRLSQKRTWRKTLFLHFHGDPFRGSCS